MNVFGHHNKTQHSESEFRARLLQHSDELIALARSEKWQPAVTTERNEVQMPLSVVSLQTLWHGPAFYRRSESPPFASAARR
jgi:hypothetical protein